MQLVANFIHKSTCLSSENRTGDISSYTLILNRFQTIHTAIPKIFHQHSSNEHKQIFIIWYAVYCLL